MKNETYTPGHHEKSKKFMMRRSLKEHGGFFADLLEYGHNVLDIGCGPGNITREIARKVMPGSVIGMDSQIEQSKIDDQENKTLPPNLSFVEGNAYQMSFAENQFDRVLIHALLEHLRDPLLVLKEAYRVLKPGGIIGVCSPDADGWIVAPMTAELREALDNYIDLQSSNGGNLKMGKLIGGYLLETGFINLNLGARYECYHPTTTITEYLGVQLEKSGRLKHAQTLKEWGQRPNGLFAQTWVFGTGMKPD